MNQQFSGFAQAYTYTEGSKTYICYRSAAFVYEEVFADGRLCPANWNHSGYPAQTITVPATDHLNPDDYLYPNAFVVGINGQDLISHFEWRGFETEQTELGLQVRVGLKHSLCDIEVTVHTILDGSGVLMRYLSVDNQGDGSVALSKLTIMGGCLDKTALTGTAPPHRVGYMHAAQWGTEGDFHWHDITGGSFSFGRHIYNERYRIPFFLLENSSSGNTVVGHLAHSGGFAIAFHSLDAFYSKTRYLSYAVCIENPSPMRIIDAKECYQTPSFHIGMTHAGVDAAVNLMNDHIRLFSSPYPKHMLVESCIGPEVSMNEQMVMAAIDRFSQMGAEVFFIDASWYGPEGSEKEWFSYAGDWNPQPFRYQRSMADIRDYVHQKGMKFGLWMDVEKLGCKSRPYQSHQLPELIGYDGKPVPDETSNMLDISHPQGAAWAFEQICSVIDRYQLDFFRLDSGSFAPAGVHQTGTLLENTDLRYYENWYAIFSRLRKKYPNVIFQNCSGGGSRTDIGMVSLMSNTWYTDYQTAPRSFSIINGVSMYLPPEYLVRIVGGQSSHTSGSIDFQLTAARFGIPVLGYNLPVDVSYCTQQLEKIKAMIQTYKQIVRPMLKGCAIYHKTPEIMSKDEFGILEVAAADRKSAMMGVFSLVKPTCSTITVRFQGIEPAGEYDILINDHPYGRKDGFFLTQMGITLDIPTALDARAIIVKQGIQ